MADEDLTQALADVDAAKKSLDESYARMRQAREPAREPARPVGTGIATATADDMSPVGLELLTKSVGTPTEARIRPPQIPIGPTGPEQRVQEPEESPVGMEYLQRSIGQPAPPEPDSLFARVKSAIANLVGGKEGAEDLRAAPEAPPEPAPPEPVKIRVPEMPRDVRKAFEHASRFEEMAKTGKLWLERERETGLISAGGRAPEPTEAVLRQQARERAAGFKAQALKEGARPEDLGATQPEYMPGFSEAQQVAIGAGEMATGGLLTALGNAYGLQQPEAPKRPTEAFARGAGQAVGFLAGPLKVGAAGVKALTGKALAVTGADTLVTATLKRAIADEIAPMVTASMLAASGRVVETAMDQGILEAMKVEGEAAADGFLLGAIFGGTKYLVPGNGMLRGAARFGAASAALDSTQYLVHGTEAPILSLWGNPQDPNVWAEAALHYGINALVMFRGVQTRGEMRKTIVDLKNAAEAIGVEPREFREGMATEMPGRVLTREDLNRINEQRERNGQPRIPFREGMTAPNPVTLDDVFRNVVQAKQAVGEEKFAQTYDYFKAKGYTEVESAYKAAQALLQREAGRQAYEVTKPKREMLALPPHVELSPEAKRAMDNLVHAGERAKEQGPSPVEPEPRRPPTEILPERKPPTPEAFLDSLDIMRNDLWAATPRDAQTLPDWMRELGLKKSSRNAVLLDRALGSLIEGVAPDAAILPVQDAITKWVNRNWLRLHTAHGIEEAEIGKRPPAPAAPEPTPAEKEGPISAKGAEKPEPAADDYLQGLDDLGDLLGGAKAEEPVYPVPGLKALPERTGPKGEMVKLAAEPSPLMAKVQAIVNAGKAKGLDPEKMRQDLTLKGVPSTIVDAAIREAFPGTLPGGATYGTPQPEVPAVEGAPAAARPEAPAGGGGRPAAPVEGEAPAATAGAPAPEVARPEAPAPTGREAEAGPPVLQPGVAAGPRPAEAAEQPSSAGRIEGGGGGTDVPGADGKLDAAERIVTLRASHTAEAPQDARLEPYLKVLTKIQVQDASRSMASMDREGAHLLANGTGTGKSFTAVAIADIYRRAGDEVVWVAPASALQIDKVRKRVGGTVKEAAELLGVPVKVVMAAEPVLDRNAVNVMSYETFKKLPANPGRVLFIDEAHYLKNFLHQSQRGMHGVDATNQAKAVLFMTASPLDKAVHIAYLEKLGIYEGKTQLEALRALGLYIAGVNKEGFPIYRPMDEDATRAKIEQKFDRLTTAGRMTTREISLKAVINGKEGQVEVQTLRVLLPPESQAVTQRILDGFAGHPGATEDELPGWRKAVALNLIRLQHEPFKIPATVNLIKKEIAEGRKVIVFLNRVNESEAGQTIKIRGPSGEVIDEIREVYAKSEGTAKTLRALLADENIKFAELHGGATETRAQAMENFQIKDAQVILATPGSGGIGISLDDRVGDKPRTMVIMTAPYSGIENIQAIGRAWRLKTMSFPKIIYMHSGEMIDERNMAIVVQKMAMLGAAVKTEIAEKVEAEPERGGRVLQREVKEQPLEKMPVEGAAAAARQRLIQEAPKAPEEPIVEKIERAPLGASQAANYFRALDPREVTTGNVREMAPDESLGVDEAALLFPDGSRLAAQYHAEMLRGPEGLSQYEVLKEHAAVRLRMVGESGGGNTLLVSLHGRITPEQFREIMYEARKVSDMLYLDAHIPGMQARAMHPTSSKSEFRQMLEPFVRTIEKMEAEGGRAVAGFDPRLVKVLGGNLYSGDLPRVAVKEGLQNSIDALRELPDPSAGAIKVTMETGYSKDGWGNRVQKLSIEDNGAGMLPEVAKKELVDIGGSKKGEQATGGFGIAKVAIFANSETIQVITTARRPDGTKVQTILSGSGEDWLDPKKGFAVQTSQAGESVPTGTRVSLTFKPEVMTWSHAEAASWALKFQETQRLPFKFSFTLDGEQFGQERMEVQHLTDLTVDGAKIEIYRSPQTIETQHVYINILNNGMPQFRDVKYLSSEVPLPQELTANIKPTATPEAADYPFRPDREGLRGKADEAIKKYVEEKLYNEAAKKAGNRLKVAMRTAPRFLNTQLRIVDTHGGALKPETMRTLIESPEMKRLTQLSRRTYDDIVAALLGYNARYGTGKFMGLGLGQNYLGIKIHKEAVQTKEHPVLLNPVAIVAEGESHLANNTFTEDYLPSFVARQIVATVLHEVAHLTDSGHSAGFAGTLTRATGLAGPVLEKNARRITKFLEANDNDAFRTIRAISHQVEDDWRAASGRGLFDDAGVHLAAERAGAGGGEGAPEAGPGGGVGPAEAVPAGRERAPELLEPGAAVERGGPRKPALPRLSEAQRHDLLTVGREALQSIPDREAWEHWMKANLPEAYHAYLDGVYKEISAPTGRAPISVDKPMKDPVLTSAPARIANPWARAAVVATRAGSSAEPVERVNLLNKMRDLLDIPIRTGRMGQMKKNVLGFFKVRAEVVRTRVENDMATLSHEAGHYISKLLLGSIEHPTQTRNQFMVRHDKALTELSLTHAKPSSEEGFAEWMRLYLTNPAAVRAPEFQALTADIEARLKAVDEGLLAAFQNWSEDYRAWRGSTLSDRMEASTAWDQVTTRRDVGDSLRAIYTGLVAANAPIERAVKDMADGKPLSADKNAAMLFELLANSNSRVDLFIRKNVGGVQGGAISPKTLRRVGKSLEEVLEPVKNDVRKWGTYMLLRRLKELGERDDEAAQRSARALYISRETNWREVRDEVRKIEQAHPTWKDVHDDFQEWNQHLLDYAQARGLLSRESRAMISELNQSYFPFHRVLAEEEKYQSQQMGGGGIRRLKGSGKEFLNPLESAIRNAYALIRAAEVNEAKGVLADQANMTEGAGKWMEKVPPTKKATQVLTQEVLDKVRQDLSAAGFPPETIAALSDEHIRTIVTIFRADHYNLKPNEMIYLRGGKVEHYIVEPNLKRAIDHMSAPEATMLTRLYTLIGGGKVASMARLVLEGPARLLRAGATLAPEFAARNPIRDVFDRAWYSQRQHNFPIFGPMLDLVLAVGELPRGVLSSVRGDKYKDAWLRGGGEHALSTLDMRQLQSKLADITGQRSKWRKLNPIQWLRLISKISEEANRIEETRYVLREMGAKPETATKAQLQEAAHAGLTNPLNFARMGSWVKWLGLNRLAAFFNVSIISWDKLAREFKKNPVRMTHFALATVTLPSLALWAYNQQDPRWKDIPTWQKNLSWIIFPHMVGYGTRPTQEQWDALTPEQKAEAVSLTGPIIRIPKPWQLGILFGSIPERIADWIAGTDPNFGRTLMTSLWEMRIADPTPTGAQIAISVGQNFDSFFGRPIVPRGMEDLDPEEQISQGTHESSIWIAHAISAATNGTAPAWARSPQQIDYIVGRGAANLGRLANDMIDLAAREVSDPEAQPPKGTWADVPLVRGFITRYPSGSAESIENFYQIYGETQRRSKTAQFLAKAGKDTEAYTQQHALHIVAAPAMAGTAKALTELRAAMRQVRLDPTLSREEKRQQQDALSFQMIELSRQAVENFREWEHNQKQP